MRAITRVTTNVYISFSIIFGYFIYLNIRNKVITTDTVPASNLKYTGNDTLLKVITHSRVQSDKPPSELSL